MSNIPLQSPLSPQPHFKRDMVRLVGVLLFFVGVALVLHHPVVRAEYLNIERFRARVDQTGWAGILWFIGAATALNAVGVPRVWISAAAGSVYGAVEGFSIGMVATLLGSSLDFFAGRTLLREPLKRRLPIRLLPWYELLNRHGFRAIVYLRLFPLMNSTMTSLLGGISTLPYPSYLLATFIGYIPFTVAFATLGSSAAKQNWLQMGLGMAIFLAVVAGHWLWNRNKMDQAMRGDKQ